MTDFPHDETRLKLFSLGALEAEVMAIVCDKGETSVRDVCSSLSRSLAYTTVMTTLDRLYKKDLLYRRKEGRGFYYTSRLSNKAGEEQNTLMIASDKKGLSRIPLISYLLDAVGSYDEALLEELERTIAARRQHFERKDKL